MPPLPDFPNVDPSQFGNAYLDVPYAHDDPQQTLDLYLPSTGTGPHPLIVFIHGGGWVSGDKRRATWPELFKAVYQGYALACVEYRLAPTATWPAQIDDVRCAIRFLRANDAAYHLKTDKIAVVGCSAGAHLATMLAAVGGGAILRDPNAPWRAESDAIQCLVSLYAPTDLYQLDLCDRTTKEEQAVATDGATAHLSDGEPGMDKPHNLLLGFRALTNPEAAAIASPAKFVSSAFPPAYFAHGIADHVVPYTQSVAMAKLVNEACGEGRAELTLYPDADHGEPVMKTDGRTDEMITFIDRTLRSGSHRHVPMDEIEVKLIDRP